jgi:hypothetical protein
MQSSPWTPFLLILTAPLLRAQVFIVDASQGPGFSFSRLPEAVERVPDGATLIVRPGIYEPFQIIAKKLTILAAPLVVVTSNGGPIAITVADQGTHQPVLLRGLHLASVTLALRSVRGAVHLEDCVSHLSLPATCEVVDCTQVSMSRCAFLAGERAAAAAVFRTSNVVCVDSGFYLTSATPDTAALALQRGRTQLVRSSVLGGQSPTSHGITMLDGQLRVLGPGSVETYGSAPSITGTGTVLANSLSILNPRPSSSITLVTVADAATWSTPATLGGTTTGSLESNSGHLGALLFGLPAARQLVTGFAEELWLAPTSAQIVGVGVLTWPLGNLARTVRVPALPALLGSQFGWQGLTADPARGLVFANPAWFSIM